MIEDKKAYARQWYQKNKAKVLSKQRAKYKKNSAAKLEACKNYRDNNKEAVAEGNMCDRACDFLTEEKADVNRLEELLEYDSKKKYPG